MNNTARFALVLLIAACALLVPAVAAAEHTVAPSGAEFTGIQSAIDRASPGDTVTVESGTYPENIRLDKKISLVGIDSGGGAPIIDPQKKGNAVEILADECVVEGFVIRDSALLSGIRVVSSGNTIGGNTLDSNAQGILLIGANRNTISGNNVTNSDRFGITLENSNDNLIEDNIVTKNSVGIALDEFSLTNKIYRNNFGNTQNVISKSPTTTWDSPVDLTYTYLGLKEQSRMGNYWSDYRGKDRNGDGIGDTSYMILLSGSKRTPGEPSQNILDSFPLMDPKEYYTGIAPVSGITGTSVTVSPTLTSSQGTIQPTPTFTLTVTRFPTTTAPVVNTVTPAGPGSPAGRTESGIPWGTLGIVLLFLIAAGAGGFFFFRRREGKGRGMTREVPASTIIPGSPVKDDTLAEEVPVMQPVSLATTPVVDTKPAAVTTLPEATHTEPHTSAVEQKSYFPRELENKYTDIGYVGRGGIAWVFSALRKSDGVKVAVKIPIGSDEMTGRSFLNEIKAWETLRHPNIVEISAVNILPVPYVEMEFVPGSLEALEKPIPVWKAVHLVKGIADGMSYAHQQGFIHRDIKPHNILLTEDLVPKITDWGMSKVLAADVKNSSIAGFSLSYAAPEQVSPSEFGRTDERTDVYQIGVVFYELVTGSIPFGGESIVEVGNAILREKPLLPSEYNPDAAAVEKIILKCLEKNPADRFQTAAELLDALSRYLDEDDE